MLPIIKSCRGFVNISTIFLAIVATAATLLGFAGDLWWGFELLEHPRLQYCQILLLALVIGIILRQRWSIIWLFPLGINLVIVLPLCLPPHQNQSPGINAPAHTLRILHANLDRQNSHMNWAIEYIDSQTVDVVLLQEITPLWLNQLQNHLQNYQLITAEPRENSHGSALLLPTSPTQPLTIKGIQTIYLPEYSQRPLIETIFCLGGTKFVVLSLHITRSRNSGTSAFQQTEFNAVANWSQIQQKAGKQVVLIGDFNTTPWSSRFRQLLKDSDLKNSQQGYGFQTTWLASLPAPLRIPIDHCLHSQAFTTINRKIGINIGSDHLPLLVELRLYERPKSPDWNIAMGTGDRG